MLFRLGQRAVNQTRRGARLKKAESELIGLVGAWGMIKGLIAIAEVGQITVECFRSSGLQLLACASRRRS